MPLVMETDAGEVEVKESFVVVCPVHHLAFGPYDDADAATAAVDELGHDCPFEIVPMLTPETGQHSREEWSPKSGYL